MHALQLLSWQSDVASHKQQNKRLQEDNQRLQNQMLATGERLERMAQDASLDLSKEVLKLQRQLAGKRSFHLVHVQDSSSEHTGP